jgi:hypothetical protein
VPVFVVQGLGGPGTASPEDHGLISYQCIVVKLLSTVYIAITPEYFNMVRYKRAVAASVMLAQTQSPRRRES